VCLLGPPKEILTDQCSEFVNSILTTLLSKSGCNHRLTSAYHPRTNGATERLNQTLINILKQLTEENQSNWDILLPSNGLAYRPRIHTLTQ
jgi:transposase InsO family protein